MNSNQCLPTGDKPLGSFIERLETIDDPRDNRGKKHILSFVLAGVILGIMAGRQSTSSIYRFIRNRIDWLRDVTGHTTAKPISRAQLPRILSVVDLQQLNEIVEIQLGVRLQLENETWSCIEIEKTTESEQIQQLNQIENHQELVQKCLDSSLALSQNQLDLLEVEEDEEIIIDFGQQPDSQMDLSLPSSNQNLDLLEVEEDKEIIIDSSQQPDSQSQVDSNSEKWLAYDGKSLRGTEQERILLAVTHAERRVLAQRPMSGPKNSEVIAVRELLTETNLANYNVTLDALHLAPITTTMIAESGQSFIIQAKANQPTLMRQLKQVASSEAELGQIKTVGKGHGRIEKRCATFFSVAEVKFAPRWASSHFQTLIVMERERFIVKKNKHTSETSYYLSNQLVNHGDKDTQRQVAGAIRAHWQIETPYS